MKTAAELIETVKQKRWDESTNDRNRKLTIDMLKGLSCKKAGKKYGLGISRSSEIFWREIIRIEVEQGMPERTTLNQMIDVRNNKSFYLDILEPIPKQTSKNPSAQKVRCKRCGEVLSVSMFSKNPANKSGVHSYCKECVREYNLERRSRIESDTYKTWVNSHAMSHDRYLILNRAFNLVQKERLSKSW